MTDIARIGFRVDTKEVERGSVVLTQFGQNASRSASAITRATRSMNSSFTGVTNALGRNRFAVVNAANQFSDFAVQVGGGVPVTRALSQQLPQLTAFMGPLAAVTGVAAGVLIGFAGSMIQAREEAKTSEQALADLEGAFSSLRDAQELTSSSLSSVIERYGRFDTQVQNVIASLERVSLASFRGAVDEAIASFDEFDGEVGTALDLLSRFETATGRTLGGVRSAFESLDPAVREAAQAIANLQQTSSSDLEAVADAALEAVTALEQVNDTDYGPAIAAIVQLADVAAQQFGRISQSAGDAFGAFNFTPSDVQGGRGAPATASPFGQFTSQLNRESQIILPGAGGGGGGGGGAGRVAAEVAAADSIIRQAERSAVQYSEVLGVLDQRLASGAITQGTYNEALSQAQQQFLGASDAARFWEQQNASLKDGILDSIVAGGDLAQTFEQIAKSIARAALEAALFGTGPLAGLGGGAGGGGGGLGLIGSLFGSIFTGLPIFDGGGFTGSGSRSGGVDGRGGFPAILHPNEYVTDLTRGGGMATGGMNVEVNNYAGVDVQPQRTRGPDGREMLKIEIRAMHERGELDGALGNRYGASPRARTRA